MFCSKCGAKNEDGAQFCVQCGNPLTAASQGASKEKLENLYQLARRARNENNAENAAKYYGMILIDEPNDWEASFYAVYYTAMQTKIAYISSSANTVNNCLSSTFTLIISHLKDDDKKAAMTEVYTQVHKLASVMLTSTQNTYYRTRNNTTNYNAEYYRNSMIDYLDRAASIGRMLMVLGDLLESQYIATSDEDLKQMALSSWKESNSVIYVYWSDLDRQWQEITKSNVREVTATCSSKIQKYEPGYKSSLESVSSNNTPAPAASGGCYVATAVYHSYDCPQVWTLRRFRDDTLAGSWYGRAFVRLYYAVSPTLVRWFGETAWFQKLWRGPLDRLVARLQAKGVEDTPYEDKIW